MDISSKESWYTAIHKKYIVIISICIILCILAVAYVICKQKYEIEKKDILTQQKEALELWTVGTVKAISLWTDELDALAKRVSTSELFRIFATDAYNLDEKNKAIVNDPDVAALSPSEDASMLAEQVPLMRNILLDFMNYNGMLDARIVNAHGQTLLSSLSRPTPVTKEQRAAIAAALSSNSIAFTPVRESPAGLVLDFVQPLRPVLSHSEESRPVAAILLTTPVTGQIAQFLARDMRQIGSAKARLLQKHDADWEEIQVQSASPILLSKEMALPVMHGAMPFALRPALQNESKVYSLGTPVPGLEWLLVIEVPAQHINARLDSEARMIFGIGALVSIGFILLLALLWWVGIGRQQRNIAQRFKNLYQVINNQKRLLDGINVSLEVGLIMADEKGEIQVSNRFFAQMVHQENADLKGATFASLFDGRVSGILLDGIRKVVGSGETTSFEIEIQDTLFRVTLFPFIDTDEAENTKGAVAIFQDITEFRRNSERRRRQQINTIAALVRAIEGVDPYLAGHSHMMETLSGLVARQLQLDEHDKNTLKIAASLSQIGKIFVPRELLAKTGELSQEEQQELMRVPEYAYTILRDIDFDLPVPQAVYEMYERMDGTGYPQRLKGKDISLPARILAVVNAFCAMVSPRSYRNSMPVDKAIRALHSNPGSFDPEIVQSLEAVLRTPEGAQAVVRNPLDTV